MTEVSRDSKLENDAQEVVESHLSRQTTEGKQRKRKSGESCLQ
jgi:hypothetical protein